MGYFTTSSTSSSFPPTPTSTPQSNQTPTAPDRSARLACWTARDAYFSCLDIHNILSPLSTSDDSAELAKQKCGKEEEKFERDCVKSWVTYFKQRRVVDAKKAETLERLRREGAEEVPEGVARGMTAQQQVGAVAGKK